MFWNGTRSRKWISPVERAAVRVCSSGMNRKISRSARAGPVVP